MEAKVSIIIPVYNGAAYLAQCIESVFAQSCQEWELIIVDNGSSDETPQIISSYYTNNKEKVFPIRLQKNEGVAAARNLGMAKSRGCYLAFLDADDIWLPEKLTKQLSFMQEHPGYSCVYGACLRIDAQGKRLPRARRQFQGYSGNIFEALLYRNFVPSPTPLIRKSLAKGLAFRNIFYEDWHFWLQLALEGSFHFLKEELAYYRSTHYANGAKHLSCRD